LLIVTLLGWQICQAADSDLQLWSVGFVNHDFNDTWAASMQLENRISNDGSDKDATIIKPGGYYRINPRLQFGLGYKYQSKTATPDEQDLWQEVYYKTPFRKYDFTHQVRLEERFINNVGGVIARLRYLIHLSYPLTDNTYLAAHEAVRFNLNNKHEGPVSGFEQNRLYFGFGVHTSKIMKIEFGYLWRYERERDAENLSDHAIRLQFLFNTKGRPHPSHAGT
jgi:hypothetical protein